MPKFAPPVLGPSSFGFELVDHVGHLVTWVTPLYELREGQYGEYYEVRATALCHDCRKGFRKSKVMGGVANRLANTIIINERAKPPRKTSFASGRVGAVEGLAPNVKPRYELHDCERGDLDVIDKDLQRCATPQRSGELIADVDAFEDDEQTLPGDARLGGDDSF